MAKPLVIITGPTAAGKTGLSVKLAKKINGEIISADSMQVYTGMDIGTAKISKEEMCGIPHHMIDIMEPAEEFNVALFKKHAVSYINEITARGHIPIIVGGTGFYIRSVLYDTEFTSCDTDYELRQKLFDYAKENGNDALHAKLLEVDPVSAEAIHANNVKRVVRAIEYHTLTGECISEHNTRESMKSSPYNFAYFVINMDRKELYDRIDRRVDIMINNGLVDEVKELTKKGLTKDMVSMKGLGYKEIIEYFEGALTLDESIELIKKETRHFAKRQLTWFRREKDVIWLDKSSKDEDALTDEIIQTLKRKGIME
ncbi:MAG: tRNA (adenosine(37)-N6)-dimethylallyltransferase MiaA [Lachnospiraceae bacterium]|jgi:tRNA dimethylallyltransferase